MRRLDYLLAALLGVLLGLGSLAAGSVWNGGGTTNDWSDAANWDAAPSNGSPLTFTGTTRQSNTNNTGLTSAGLVTFSNDGFNIGGNPLTLDAGITNTAGNNTWGISSTVNAAQNFTVTGGMLTVSGNLSGAGVATKTGALTLAGNNSGFSGAINNDSGNTFIAETCNGWGTGTFNISQSINKWGNLFVQGAEGSAPKTLSGNMGNASPATFATIYASRDVTFNGDLRFNYPTEYTYYNWQNVDAPGHTVRFTGTTAVTRTDATFAAIGPLQGSTIVVNNLTDTGASSTFNVRKVNPGTLRITGDCSNFRNSLLIHGYSGSGAAYYNNSTGTGQYFSTTSWQDTGTIEIATDSLGGTGASPDNYGRGIWIYGPNWLKATDADGNLSSHTVAERGIRACAWNTYFAGNLTFGWMAKLTARDWSNSQPVTFTHAWTVSADSTLTVPGIGEFYFNGSDPQNLIKDGPGTVKVTGPGSYRGYTRVLAGTLELNYAGDSGEKLSDTAALELAGGRLSIVGNASAGIENVASTAVRAGGSTVAQVSGATQLNLKAASRDVGGTVNFLKAGGAADATISNANTNSILGGWATFNGADWAVNSTGGADGAVGALASYAVNVFTDGTSNTVVSGAQSPGSPVNVNSLRFNSAGATLTLPAGASVIQSGGILVTPNVGAGALSITGAGTLSGPGGGDLIVHQFNPGDANKLTIGATVTGNALTKSGPGALELANAGNDYSGGTYLNDGKVIVSSAGNLGGGGLIFHGGTLQIASGAPLFDTAKAVTLDGAGGTVQVENAAGARLSGALSGGGGLTKAGSGPLTLGSLNSYRGQTVVSQGDLILGANATSMRPDSLCSVDAANSKVKMTGDVYENRLVNGDQVMLSPLTSAAPGGLAVGIPYYVINKEVDGVTFQLAATPGGSAIALSSAGAAVKLNAPGSLGWGNSEVLLGDANTGGGTVRLLTSGAYDVQRPIRVANYGAGTTIGGNTDDDSTFSGDIRLDKTGRLISVTTGARTVTFSGRISGVGGIEKIGAGAATLDAGNTFTGPTTVSAGTLALGASGAIDQTPTILVSGSALFDVSAKGGDYHLLSGQTLMGKGLVTGGVIADSGSHLTPGASVGTLTFSSLTLSGGSILDFEFGSAQNDYADVQGLLTLNGGGFNLFQEGTTNPFSIPGTYPLLGYAGTLGGLPGNLSVLNAVSGLTYSFLDNANARQVDLIISSGQAQDIPEPCTIALLGLAVTGLGGYIRRRRAA